MFDVPWWVKGLAVLALLGALFAGVEAFRDRAYHQGYDAAKADAQKAFNKAAGEAKAREDKLRSDLAAIDAQRYVDNLRHEKIVADLTARARAGAIGLRVDVAGHNCPKPEVGPVAARPGDETRADLVPGVAATVLRIAADSARDVRRYNDLVDRYNRAREICNAEPVTP